MIADGSIVFLIMVFASIAYSIYEALRDTRRKTQRKRQNRPSQPASSPQPTPAENPTPTAESPEETLMRRLEEWLSLPNTTTKQPKEAEKRVEKEQEIQPRVEQAAIEKHRLVHNATNQTSKELPEEENSRVEFDLRQAVIHSEILKPKFREEEL